MHCRKLDWYVRNKCHVPVEDTLNNNLKDQSQHMNHC